MGDRDVARRHGGGGLRVGQAFVPRHEERARRRGGSREAPPRSAGRSPRPRGGWRSAPGRRRSRARRALRPHRVADEGEARGEFRPACRRGARRGRRNRASRGRSGSRAWGPPSRLARSLAARPDPSHGHGLRAEPETLAQKSGNASVSGSACGRALESACRRAQRYAPDKTQPTEERPRVPPRHTGRLRHARRERRLGADAAQLRARLEVRGPRRALLRRHRQGLLRGRRTDVTIEAEATGRVNAIPKVATGAFPIGFADFNTRDALPRPEPRRAGDRRDDDLRQAAPSPSWAASRWASTEPKDLEGKVLGAPPPDGAWAQFPIFAAENGLDVSKITVEPVGFPTREPMLAEGNVAAVTGFSFSSVIGTKRLGVPAEDISNILMADYGVDALRQRDPREHRLGRGERRDGQGLPRAPWRRAGWTPSPTPTRRSRASSQRNPAIDKALEKERLMMAIDAERDDRLGQGERHGRDRPGADGQRASRRSARSTPSRPRPTPRSVHERLPARGRLQGRMTVTPPRARPRRFRLPRQHSAERGSAWAQPDRDQGRPARLPHGLGPAARAGRAELSVPEGDFAAVVGPSGCGKSTLTRLVAGLMIPDEGEVWLHGERVKGPRNDGGHGVPEPGPARMARRS